MQVTGNKYLYELYTWIRTLDYLQQENVYLKNHIADIIRHGISAGELEHLENFQNRFINKDAILALLRHDIVDQIKLTERVKGKAKLDKLRKDMRQIESEFSNLKFEFNNYLAHA
jgi:hypothetical protein